MRSEEKTELDARLARRAALRQRVERVRRQMPRFGRIEMTGGLSPFWLDDLNTANEIKDNEIKELAILRIGVVLLQAVTGDWRQTRL